MPELRNLFEVAEVRGYGSSVRPTLPAGLMHHAPKQPEPPQGAPIADRRLMCLRVNSASPAAPGCHRNRFRYQLEPLTQAHCLCALPRHVRPQEEGRTAPRDPP